MSRPVERHDQQGVSGLEIGPDAQRDRAEFPGSVDALPGATTDGSVRREGGQQDEAPGTGAALSPCQEIADTHGGGIRVESDPSEESTFSVTPPRQAD